MTNHVIDDKKTCRLCQTQFDENTSMLICIESCDFLVCRACNLSKFIRNNLTSQTYRHGYY
jgi:hypothetical protein